MTLFYFICRYFMYFFIPLVVTALGGMFSERSGVTNMALDSIMIWGAMWGFLFMNAFAGSIPPQLLLVLSLLVAGLTGVVFALLLAYSAVNLKANQTIAAMGMNTFAPAFAIFFVRVINTGSEHLFFQNNFRIDSVPILGKIPLIGPMFFQQVYLTNYIGIALIILSVIIINKTRFGLRLCACGENPQAADSLGINVYKIRYAGVMISGFLAGLGGLMYVLPISTAFSCTVSGYGFLALAVVIFGQWRPLGIFGAAAFFSLMKTLASSYTSIPFLASLPFPDAFYKSLPFMITLIALAFSSKNSRAPKAAGVPYDKGKR